MAFLPVAHEILQKESPAFQMQVSTVLALHEAAKGYLIFPDGGHQLMCNTFKMHDYPP